MKKLASIFVFFALLLTANLGYPANTPPPGNTNDIIINKGSGQYAGLSVDTLASYTAHDTVMNGLAYDPRNPTYGAICGGLNTFLGDGSTKTFTYTIPFTGSSSTDNTHFMVFYEPTSGGGSATILNTGQFTVTGVNSGIGGTITLTSAPPSANVLFVVHDDGPGFISASTAAVATGGYISVPDGCTIYTSQANGTQLAEGANVIGQNFTPQYGYQGQGQKPILTVLAPTGSAPEFGFNVTNKTHQFFEGFEITELIPAYSSVSFQTVPVLIGANGADGAGGGTLPGITVQYMTFNYASVGFGAPIGGNSAYIFATARFNNFTANNAGIYGPLSDQVITDNDFVSNGQFGSIGNAGGMVIGPQEGAPGASGAARIARNRFEFNIEGIVIKSGALISLDDNQFDGNAACGLDLNTFWADINVTGGWFRGNANGGGSFEGNTNAGQDAHICFNGGAGSSGFYASNVVLVNNYGEGSTAPLGSPNATTPPYALDFTTTGANNNNVDFEGGSAPFGAGAASNASTTDFAIYRNGRPTNLKYNFYGTPVQGGVANGSFPSQARGLPANSWSHFYAIGGIEMYGYEYSGPETWPTIIAKNMGTGPTLIGEGQTQFSTFDCDIVNDDIMPTFNPLIMDNGVVAWLPGISDQYFGGGFYQAHLADTSACRLGALTWMATPQKYKTYAQASSVTTTGSWGNSAIYGGALAVTSTTQNSALTFTITTAGPLYVGYELQATATGVASGGAFTVSVDGALATTVSTGGNASWTYVSACSGLCPTSQTAAAVRVPIKGGGSHSIVTNVISSTTSANPVTILGVWTPPNVPYHGSTPTVYLGGQAGLPTYPNANLAFNNDEMIQANQLFADGLSVNFVPVQNYLSTADYLTGSNQMNSLGNAHVSDAFSAIMQYHKDNSRAISPLDFGASCNARYFGNNFYSAPYNQCVETTQGSPVISVANYNFQPGVATQNGGGDVGKLAILSSYYDQGPTATILSVSTTAGGSSAILNENMAVTNSCEHMLMFGYPTNPNDPTTAADDTIPIQNATYAAVQGSGIVQMPNNCVVHDLRMASGSTLQGNNGANTYYGGYSETPTILWAGFTGYPDDVDTTTNLPRNLGIDVAYTVDTAIKNLTISSPTFSYLGGHTGMGAAACAGAISDPNGTDFAAQAFLTDQVTFFLCPVGLNVPMGFGSTINFTASIAPGPGSLGTMTVLAITSTALSVTCPPNNSNNCTVPDWLAVGNVITGSSVTSGTTILRAALAGQTTGTYLVSLSQTVTSESMHTVPPSIQASYYVKDSQFLDDGWGIFGITSDSTIDNSVFTGSSPGGGYMAGWFNGPGTGDDGANRIIGGRMEECGSYCIIMDANGNSMQITGMQFQTSGLGPIQILGDTADLSITGGWCDQYYSNPVSCITLSGSGGGLTVTGMEYDIRTTDAILAVTTGNTFDYVSFIGGQVETSSTPPIFYSNQGGALPKHYINSIAGYPPVNNYHIPVISGLSLTSTTGSIYSGGGLAAVTSGTATLTFGTLPACPNNWNCTGGDAGTTPVLWPMSATSSTSCSLLATTTSGDPVYWNGACH